MTALSQFILAPFLWSFWLVLFGLLAPAGKRRATLAGGLGQHVSDRRGAEHRIHWATAVSGRKHKHLMAWAPTMHFYSPLGAIAAYKALYELVLKPFFWDKTAHGLSLAAIRATD